MMRQFKFFAENTPTTITYGTYDEMAVSLLIHHLRNDLELIGATHIFDSTDGPSDYRPNQLKILSVVNGIEYCKIHYRILDLVTTDMTMHSTEITYGRLNRLIDEAI